MTQNERTPVRSRRRTQAEGQRWHRISVTFTDAELAEITAAAERSRMAVPTWLGKTGLAAARSHEMPASEALRDLLRAVISVGAEARRQGNNINQAVTQLHSTGELQPGIERHLQDALDKVTEATGEVNAAMRHVRDKL
jgi:hypothetical protein